MCVTEARECLERHQIILYFASIGLGLAVAWYWPGSNSLEPYVNACLALMLFVTFLQVPLTELGIAFTNIRFIGALLVGNFLFIPLLVVALLKILPVGDPLLLLGVLFVLLTPCIDYVVTFAHLGEGDSKALLASTPLLLVVQMLLLPVYLSLFVGAEARDLVRPEPFLHAFLFLIAAPLTLAMAVQWAARTRRGVAKAIEGLAVLPVPATALVLFIVICAVVPQLGAALESVRSVLPIYILFALVAPVVGLATARIFALPTSERRALAFSTATRNSLVVLPLALAVPGAIPIIPAVIIAQTLVELISELIYIRVVPRMDRMMFKG